MSAATKRVIAAIYKTDDPAGVIWKVIVATVPEAADPQETVNRRCRPDESALLLTAPIDTHGYRVIDGALQPVPGL